MFRIFIHILIIFLGTDIFAAAQTDVCQQRHCMAVVDAGSTGSRLHIYAYDQDNHQDAINIKNIYSKKIKPGLTTIPLKQANIDKYLVDLFAESSEKQIPVYFYATGGMRLIATQQQLYFDLVKQWLEKQPQWKLQDARLISGTEEGVFGWLAVNYETGLLTSPQNKSLSGMMDIGGASTQIAFPVNHPEKVDKQDLIQFDLYGRHLSLYSHSFLGLGGTEVLHRFQDSSACFSKGYPMPNGNTGQGDALSCQQTISQSINKEFEVNRMTKIALDNNLASSWYVLGAVSSMVKEEPMLFETDQFTPQLLLEKANADVCTKNWDMLKATYSKNDYLATNCLLASYYASLVEQGYGLSPEQVIHCMPNDKDSDWTLGVVLHHS